MIRTTTQSSRIRLIALWTLLLLYALPLLTVDAQSNKAAAVNNVTIKLDGEKLRLVEPVRKLDGRLFVPVSRIAAMFGAKVKWDDNNEEATIHTVLGDTIVLGNEVPVVYFNDERYIMDTPPFLADSRMYIPLRDAAELMHAQMEWIAAEETAELVTVRPAVVTEDYGLTQISKETGSTTTELLMRNGLDSNKEIKEGTKLRVVMPSLFDRKAKPFTEKDMLLLAKITQVEAGYESYEGQLGVANVILNRMKDSRFPNSVKDVIYSGRQFPPAHNGKLDKSKPNASVLRAAKDAFNGKNNVEKAVYFFNPKVSKGSFWDKLDVIVTIGHHSFAK